MTEKKKRTRIRRGAALLAGLGVLVVAELVLRAAGIAPPGVSPEELFLNRVRVFEREGEMYSTIASMRRHFVPQRFAARKPANTKRIFIVGGSTAMGFPLETFYGPSQLLASALPALDPAASYEVVSASGFGYALYRLVPVVEEVLEYDPDALVLMTGHNEYLERRFAGGKDGLVTRLGLYRVLAGLVSHLRGRTSRVDWEPHIVSNAERRLVLADFERSLERIARTCSEKGVPLVILTSPPNIQDFRPNGESVIPSSQREKIDGRIKQGGMEPLLSALSIISKLENEHGADAWLRFEHGAAFYAMARLRSEQASTRAPGETARMGVLDKEAAKYLAYANDYFLVAVNLDPVPVRATQRINAIIRKVARSGATLADLDRLFDFYRINVEHHDGDLFFDHCHLNPEGQERAAIAMIEGLVKAGVLNLNAADAGGEETGWESIARQHWSGMRRRTPDPVMAEALYKVAYETGANMGRVHRGLRYARRALELDPAHEKASRLVERLLPKVQETYPLTGD